MKVQTLQEFAENLRVSGDWREADFADEILALIDLETEVAEPYSDLCDDIAHYAPPEMEAARGVEWLGDRSNLLAEIEAELTKAELKGDVDDLVKGMIGTLKEAEAILEAAGWPGDGDFISALQALADRPAPPEYDL